MNDGYDTKETKFTVHQIWDWLHRNPEKLSHLHGWDIENEIDTIAKNLPMNHDPVTLVDILIYSKQHSSSGIDINCLLVLFHLVDLTSIDEKTFTAFNKAAFHSSYPLLVEYFEKRYRQQSKPKMNNNNALFQMIEKLDLNKHAPDWSKESIEYLEALAFQLIQQHQPISWRSFYEFRHGRDWSLNHVCLAFNMVDFKSAPIKNVETFVEEEAKKYLKPFGEYLQMRYKFICDKLIESFDYQTTSDMYSKKENE